MKWSDLVKIVPVNTGSGFQGIADSAVSRWMTRAGVGVGDAFLVRAGHWKSFPAHWVGTEEGNPFVNQSPGKGKRLPCNWHSATRS